jgi:hypothetical protein
MFKLEIELDLGCDKDRKMADEILLCYKERKDYEMIGYMYTVLSISYHKLLGEILVFEAEMVRNQPYTRGK